MSIKLGLQLYSVRDELEKDFEGTIAKIAAMGYQGVETAGLPKGVTYKEAKLIFDKYNLETPSAFVPVPVGDDLKIVLEIVNDLKCKKIVTGKSADHFSSLETITNTCDEFNQAYENLKDTGITLMLHNHAFEFKKVDNRIVFDIMLEQLNPNITFELDAYWTATAGVDAKQVLHDHGDRIPQLHVKDGPCKEGASMMPLGTGTLELPAIIKNAKKCEWIIVELDFCDTPMLDAVEKSLIYLKTLFTSSI